MTRYFERIGYGRVKEVTRDLFMDMYFGELKIDSYFSVDFCPNCGKPYNVFSGCHCSMDVAPKSKLLFVLTDNIEIELKAYTIREGEKAIEKEFKGVSIIQYVDKGIE